MRVGGGTIVVRGRMFAVDFPVRPWTETGLKFPARRMLPTVRAIVNHWTGAENPPDAVVRNMSNRLNDKGEPSPVSVHFIVDQLGDVYQCMDAAARASHCSGFKANDWSVGIEFINRGSDLKKPSKGIERTLRTDTIHGRKVEYCEMTGPQLVTACLLNEALCLAFALPFTVPQKDGDVYTSVLSARQAQYVRGVLAHYMLEPGKADPGVEHMRILHLYGRRTMPPPPLDVA